eukprot:752200-Hanusia_phi.AAC.2
MLSREEREALQKVEEWMAKSQPPTEIETAGKQRSRLRRSMSVMEKNSELIGSNADETLAGRRNLSKNLGSIGGSFNAKRGSLNLKRASLSGSLFNERDQNNTSMTNTIEESTLVDMTPKHNPASPLDIFTAGLINTALDWTNTSSPKNERMSRSNSIQEGISGLFSLFSNPNESAQSSQAPANGVENSDSSDQEHLDHIEAPSSGDSLTGFRSWEEKAKMASQKAKAAAVTARDNTAGGRASVGNIAA